MLRSTLRNVALLCGVLMLVPGTLWAAGAPVFETPEKKSLARAAHALKKGYYKDAMDKFERAALYGDKDAQRTLGMMHIQGTGTTMNWPLGYAWLKLAASHGDSSAVAARDEVYAQLKENEKPLAEDYVKQLDAEYGDLIALERREEWVRKQKRKITGSRTGSSAGVRIQVADASGYTWQVSGAKYFELLEGSYILEFRQHLGTVELGEFQLVEDSRPEDH